MGKRLAGRAVAIVVLGTAALLAAACSPSRRPAPPWVRSRIAGEIKGRVLSPGDWTLLAVDFLTPAQGYAVADRCAPGTQRCVAEVGGTRDGGQSFTWRPLGPGHAQAVQFVDMRRGWVLIGTGGQAQELFATLERV